jgi:FkbM family methyltransferase
MNTPPHIVAKNMHGRYCVPASSQHRPAAATVLKGQVWEARTLAFIAANCGTGDIVHAGTYFGDFLPALSKALAPGARLWAFEPSSENHACALRTIELNGLSNVTLMRAGLGDRAETGNLAIGKPGMAGGGACRIRRREKPGVDHERVPLVTVDETVPEERTVSVLQLDVEFFEQEALGGALRTIARCRPLILIETLPRDLEWYNANILALGYCDLGAINRNHVLTMSPKTVRDFNARRDRQ